MTRYNRSHRGIFYTIHNLGEGRWLWEVNPPSCVLGLRCESGEIQGELRDAMAAAQGVIERQTGQYTL